MKRFFTLALLVCTALLALSGCKDGGGEKIDYNLVFVNDSDAKIVAVAAEFQDQNMGSQNANSSPLKRGESFGFEAGEYPVTVYVYDKAVGGVVEEALARITISEAPPEGERWYVTARDGAGGLTLLTSTRLLDPDEARKWTAF